MTSNEPKRRVANYLLATVLASAFAFALAAAAPAAADVDFRVETFTHEVKDASGSPENRAGAHPAEVTTDIRFGDTTDHEGRLLPDGNVRDLKVKLPPGFVGDPTNIPVCSPADLELRPGCPDSTQIGVMEIHQTFFGGFTQPQPIYNMARSANYPAEFAIPLGVYMRAVVGPDGSLTVESTNISQGLTARGITVHLWGAPADPSHDPDRGFFGTCFPFDGSAMAPCPSGAPNKPFLSNPTSCTGASQAVTMRARSWQDADNWVVGEVALPPLEGCDDLGFNPSLTIRPQNKAADTPSAYDVSLKVPQSDALASFATAHLRSAEVTLPEGVAVNPSAADGLKACSVSEIDLETTDKSSCPSASKIGTVEIETPVLEDPMKGSVYQAKQDENPFGSTLAMYLEVEGSGVRVKLPGEISPDETTGQLTVSFDENPQLPFSELQMHLKGGSRAPLVNPPTCGTKTTEATLTPWSAPDTDPIDVSDSFGITSGPNGVPCPASLADRPFEPSMNAGVSNPVAGGSTPFTFRMTRDDGHQEILSTTVTPPQGLTAKLAGIPYCPEADIAAVSCPEESRIGSELAGAGAGSSPFYTTENPGSVYLAGPYKGAPLSMVIQEPVIAGPLDLDDISVRAAIHVDPRTAQLTVISDEIPQINSGIPLRIRELRIKMDRPDFTIAPTNCDPMSVGATVQGSHGATANLTNHFQVGDCASLGFAPKLNLSFGKGKKNTKPNAHPPLNARLRFNEGDSNISSVEVALPKGVLLDQERLGRICSRPNYAANTCPEESVVGYAKAQTPLLDDPVEGPVYLKASDNPLPDLAADLDGQIDVDLFGMIDQKENRKGLSQIRNTFDIVPDVPVSDFQLRLDGGNDGLLVNSRNICRNKGSQKVSIDMAAHNEMTSSSKPLIGSACKQLNNKKAKKLKKKAKKLQRKAKRANNPRKAKQLRKQARKLKKQARKLGR